uniref:Uncharacterized protein n=1 Tax=Amphimedon queenslandica TaxID=400682 RepID=A0A1X7TC91_AMPQE
MAQKPPQNFIIFSDTY